MLGTDVIMANHEVKIIRHRGTTQVNFEGGQAIQWAERGLGEEELVQAAHWNLVLMRFSRGEAPCACIGETPFFVDVGDGGILKIKRVQWDAEQGKYVDGFSFASC